MKNNNLKDDFVFDLEKLTPIIYKLENYSNIKSILTTVFGVVVIFSCAAWWYDQPKAAALLSAAGVVMAILLLYCSINIMRCIREIGELK